MDNDWDGDANDVENGIAETETSLPPVPELSLLMVQLLKGVLYREDNEPQWASLLRLQSRIREQSDVLLLDLVVDEAEGYAYLKSRPDPDETESSIKIPRLVARRPLSYPVSLMLALLRRRLAEFDAVGGGTRLVLSRDEMVEMMRVFLPLGTNEARLIDQVDSTLGKLVELGFLRRLKSSTTSASQATAGPVMYEVRRILKAYIDAQWLADFDARLEVYRTALSGGQSDKEVSDV